MHGITWWATVVVLSVATFTDLRYRRIPNWLVFPFMVCGVAVSTWLAGWHGLSHSLEGFGLGALVYGILFALGGMGMGDVKLMAAIGAWIGPAQLVTALIITGIVGGVFALCLAIWGGFFKEVLRGVSSLIFGWKGRRKLLPPDLVLSNPKAHKMPYAPAIAIGTLMSFLVH